MSIYVYHSNSLTELARRLAQKVSREIAENPDFFATAKIIVPNYNIANWLKLQIADINEISINVEFQYLEQGLWAVLEQLYPNTGLRYLTRPVLELSILSLLLNSKNADTDLEMVRNYLGPVDDGAYSAKIWQLSRKFARLFSEYEYHRQEIIATWQMNELHFEDDIVARIERCQRAIYQQLFREGILKSREKGEPDLATIPQFSKKIIPEMKKNLGANYPVHLFAFSHLSPFHRQLLFQLGHWLEFNIYHFNICAEYWEDVNTEYEDSRNARRIGSIQENGNEDDDENDLLKAWGRPGRETVRFLSELEEQCLTHYDFESDWLLDEIDPSSCVLRLVQYQILHRLQGDIRMPQDESIQIASCPSRYREVESVYNSILYNLQNNNELQLGDIAIFVGNFEAYYPVICAIFDRNSQFSYGFVDLNDALESLYAEAAIQLLSLAHGKFTRRDLFTLFSNPCFRTAAGLTEEEIKTWLKWVDTLNIIRGFSDINDTSIDFASNEPFTWLLGLKRLRMGKLMSNPYDDLEHTLSFEYSGLVPYEDFESQDKSLLDKFILTIELLATEIRSLTLERSAHQWQVTLTRFFHLFLGVPEHHPEEEVTRRTLVDALGQLHYLRGTESHRHLELKLIIEFLRTRLHGYPNPSTNTSPRGVSVASLRPMRPLPFKHVYILGLNENDFPGVVMPDHQDLRSFAWKSSDYTVPEVNMYLFLETITCAREKLYLSFVSRDLQKDHPLHASHIIQTFIKYLNNSVLTKPFEKVEIPLSSRSSLYLEHPFSHTDLLYNFDIQDRIMTLYELTKERPNIEKAYRTKLEKLLNPSQDEFNISLGDHHNDKAINPISITALSRFLQNPIQIGAQFRLGLFENDTINLLHLEDEPNYSQFRPLNAIVTNLIRHFFKTQCNERELARYFDKLYEYSCKSSQVPVGSYGEIDRNNVYQMLEQRIYGGENIQGSLSQLAAEVNKNTMLENVSFGPYPTPYNCTLNALEFEIPIQSEQAKTRIEIHGNVPFIWQNSKGAFTDALVISNSKAKEGQFPPSLFSAFLFYLCSSVVGRTGKENFFRIHLSHSYGVHSYSYSKMNQEAAHAYLKKLLKSIYSDDAFDLLPYSVITKTKKLAEPIHSSSHQTSVYKTYYAHNLENAILHETGNQFAPFRLTDCEKLLNPKVPHDAYDKIRERFKPLYHSHKMLLPESTQLSTKDELSFIFA